MSADAAAVLTVLVAVIAGWAVPALAMRMLMPALEAGPAKVANYRGVAVSGGLGTVWLVWGAVVVVLSVKSVVLANLGLAIGPGVADSLFAWSVPGLLVMAAFAFGLIDDAFGDASAKGFRGHLLALAKGRLTTGGLKLVGIGVAAAVAAALGLFLRAPVEAGTGPGWIASWALATVAIALAANLVNLTDLRPGRALKTYALLIATALPGTIAAAVATFDGPVEGAASVLTTLALALGPVAAVWSLDLGERGMLGDAGANAMGALAGYLIVVELPLWGIALAAAVLLALNVASERVSFSDVIERNRLLRRLDALGRLPLEERRSGEEAAQADGNAYDDDTGTGKDGAI